MHSLRPLLIIIGYFCHQSRISRCPDSLWWSRASMCCWLHFIQITSFARCAQLCFHHNTSPAIAWLRHTADTVQGIQSQGKPTTATVDVCMYCIVLMMRWDSCTPTLPTHANDTGFTESRIGSSIQWMARSYKKRSDDCKSEVCICVCACMSCVGCHIDMCRLSSALCPLTIPPLMHLTERHRLYRGDRVCIKDWEVFPTLLYKRKRKEKKRDGNEMKCYWMIVTVCM